jgi:electron transfer flavoprotein alpha subunit
MEVQDGRLVLLKPAFGGTIVASILSRSNPQLGTVRPGALQAGRREPSHRARVIRIALAELARSRVRLVSREVQAGSAGIALHHSDTVIGVGTGLGGPEHLPTIYALAEALGATVGATRRVVDAGWLPRQQQVGLTGKMIAPRLYVAVGVRGTFNHTVGIQKAGTVVAINNDPNAQIFETADYGVVADCHTFLPAFTIALVSATAARQDPTTRR